MGNNLEIKFIQNIDKFRERTLDNFQGSMENGEKKNPIKPVGSLDNAYSNTSGSLGITSLTWEVVSNKASS